ncbi:uncharacterized protein LOC133034350 [Cannabis sativa]|uniref:uncharacterized protein LOC133034350 n=1 Tax=Cannabis sativa TaxID=3483 RepID=UPI0029CA7B10|nr:uncharacterized protein LOC133034350 [Cannabis sativa]
MALKLDMSKTYDGMEWGYLRTVLLRMGFDGRWVNLIMHCVESVSYTFVHAGRKMGPVLPTRGIRQGDLISPLHLFILCAEDFFALLKKYEVDGKIHGCKVARRAPMISHMLFDDDSYVFCRANTWEADSIMELLHLYELASGQIVNIEKSSIFFSSNIETTMRIRYVGKKRIYEADDNTSFAVQSALVKCMMSESTLWCYLHLYRKQGWRILTNELSLIGKVFKARYYPNGLFLDANLGNSPSFVWRSVYEAQAIIRVGARKTVGDGSTVSILHDPWLPCPIDPYVHSNYPGLKDKNVHSLFCLDKLERNDLFTVKSAYRFLENLKGDWFEDDTSSFWALSTRINLQALEEAAMVAWGIWKAYNETTPVANQINFNVDRALFNDVSRFGMGCLT